MKNLRGFTIIELLIFVAVFAVSVSALITILVVVTGIQSRQIAVAEVNEQGQSLLQQIQYYTRNSRLLWMSSGDSTSTSMMISSFDSTKDPTTISLSSGTVYIQQGASGASEALTSNKVTISNLSFRRPFGNLSHGWPYGSDQLLFSFTVSATSTRGTTYSQSYQSSAPVLTTRAAISLMQQAMAENNTPSVSSLVATYPQPPIQGSLLVAVAASQATSVPTLADNAGDTWVMVASNTYSPINNMSIAIFTVSSARHTSTVVTATYAKPANYPEFFVYEYRFAGAGAIDSSSTQNNPNTATPSAGMLTPTVQNELVISAVAGVGISSPPAPANDYIMETSSTVNNQTQLFFEDDTLFPSNNVSSSWTFGSSVSTTAVMVSFG